MPNKFKNLYSRWKKKWERFKSDVAFDWKYPKKHEEGFLTRSFNKLAIVSTTATVVAIGGAMIGDNWMEKSYRNVFRDSAYTLQLQTDAANYHAPANITPLFIGTAETKRTIAMQEDLLTLGYPLSPAGANGEFHQEDLNALNWFRGTLGMATNEFADGRTLGLLAEQASKRRALQGELNNGGSTQQSVLRKSFVNPSLEEKARIREAQAYLTQIGLKIGPHKMNGIMDDVMVASVTEFQRKYPEELIPNGEIDFKTMQKLKNAAYQSLVASGMLDDARKQGLDDLSAIINGQQMSMDEVRKLARDYVRQGELQFVVDGVVEATQTAGFDFTYVMALGHHESGGKPWVGAGTSSAYGNFQFTDDTWLRVFGRHGAKYGYGDLSRKIKNGVVSGATAQERQYIMDLRNNPKVAALMVIEFSRENLSSLQSAVGGVIGKTDLYMAHFLGGSGGTKFIKEFRRDNTQDAAAMFPDAAASNKGVFYDSKGKARTLGDIYAYFSRSFPGNQALRMVVPQPPQPSASPPKGAPKIG